MPELSYRARPMPHQVSRPATARHLALFGGTPRHPSTPKEEPRSHRCGSSLQLKTGSACSTASASPPPCRRLLQHPPRHHPQPTRSRCRHLRPDSHRPRQPGRRSSDHCRTGSHGQHGPYHPTPAGAAPCTARNQQNPLTTWREHGSVPPGSPSEPGRSPCGGQSRCRRQSPGALNRARVAGQNGVFRTTCRPRPRRRKQPRCSLAR